MPDNDWLADQFEAHCAHLQAVAWRMLGTRSEADDAVQEVWRRSGRRAGRRACCSASP
jgi:DNA-directed RNA polymerase specialized sigma24 family protein